MGFGLRKAAALENLAWIRREAWALRHLGYAKSPTKRSTKNTKFPDPLKDPKKRTPQYEPITTLGKLWDY